MKKTNFYVRISILLVACFSLIIFTQEISAEKGFQDIGLRVYNGTQVVAIAAEPAGTLTSPLRIAKNGAIYGIVLVDPGDPNDSGLRIQTNSGIKALRKYVFLPTAYVSISMWKQQVFLNSYVVHVTVTVTENSPSGSPIVGVTLRGTWSGAYNATVSGTTDANGRVSFTSGWVGIGSTVTFTVNKITIGSIEYDLAGQTSASIGI